jgi:shikimate kinase
VVCLWASPEKIWERVRGQTHRPLLNEPDPPGKIQTLLAAREPFYRQADILVSTEMRSIREVAQQVMYQFKMARRTHGSHAQ